jgi:hypothetical protein
MKLESVRDGTVYGTEYRSVVVESGESTFETLGQLPVPADGLDGLRYRLKTGRWLKGLAERYVGQFPSVNVWPVTATDVVASADRWLFVSHDGGHTWRPVLELPPSSGPMGVLPTGFCHRDGEWYVGEYPLATDATPRLRRSTDCGETWSTLLSLPEVRHVHAVQADPYSGDLWITTGDEGEGCLVGRVRDGRLDVLGRGAQRWRAVELAFTPSAVLWGMDSVYEPTKPIVCVDRAEVGRPDPTVRTVHEVSSSVYYSATLTVDGEQWVAFSTAKEPGTDSTAPPRRQVSHSESASVVAASSASGFTEWHELAAYGKRSVPADGVRFDGVAPPANAYVFLAADPDRGLFVNPYNTATDGGSVRVFPPSYFASLG